MTTEPRPKEPGSGWCSECERRTKIRWEELYGSRGCEVYWEAVCGVCGEGLEGLEGEEV